MRSYSVQPAKADGSFDSSSLPGIESTDPLHAGEAVLGRTLALSGNRKAALVWELRDDFSPHYTVLFEADLPE